MGSSNGELARPPARFPNTRSDDAMKYLRGFRQCKLLWTTQVISSLIGEWDQYHNSAALKIYIAWTNSFCCHGNDLHCLLAAGCPMPPSTRKPWRGEEVPPFGSSHPRLCAPTSAPRRKGAKRNRWFPFCSPALGAGGSVMEVARLKKMGRNGKIPPGFVVDVKGPREIKIRRWKLSSIFGNVFLSGTNSKAINQHNKKRKRLSKINCSSLEK